MDEATTSTAAARRFLRIFALVVGVAAAAVAAVNLLAFRAMLRPDNQSIVQMLSGWGRVYKPMLYDHFDPDLAVFGASWARDRSTGPRTYGRNTASMNPSSA